MFNRTLLAPNVRSVAAVAASLRSAERLPSFGRIMAHHYCKACVPKISPDSLLPYATRRMAQRGLMHQSGGAATEVQVALPGGADGSRDEGSVASSSPSKHDPEALQNELDKVEEWLEEAHEVPFGKRSRGVSQVKRKRQEQESARRGRPYTLDRKRGAKFFYKLIYRRHALLHGFWSMKEMSNKDFGASFGCDRKIRRKEAEFIIRQQWKFGKSEYLDVLYLGKEPEEGGEETRALMQKIKRNMRAK
ncbi:hypothetical protein ACHAWF_003151 [Thalassiosira exigua]